MRQINLTILPIRNGVLVSGSTQYFAGDVINPANPEHVQYFPTLDLARDGLSNFADMLDHEQNVLDQRAEDEKRMYAALHGEGPVNQAQSVERERVIMDRDDWCGGRRKPVNQTQAADLEPETGKKFGYALNALEDGYRVTRAGWNGKGMFLQLQVPNKHSKMQRPYIYMSPVDGALVPWVASQSDMLADDWEIIHN